MIARTHPSYSSHFHNKEKEQINEKRAKRLENLVNPLFWCLVLSMVKEFYKKLSDTLISEQEAIQRFSRNFNGDPSMSPQERTEFNRKLKLHKWKHGQKFTEGRLKEIEKHKQEFYDAYQKISSLDPDFMLKTVELAESHISKQFEYNRYYEHILKKLCEFYEFTTKKSKVKQFSDSIRKKVSDGAWLEMQHEITSFDIENLYSGINLLIDLFWDINEHKAERINSMQEDMESLKCEIQRFRQENDWFMSVKRWLDAKIAELGRLLSQKEWQCSLLTSDKQKLNQEILNLRSTNEVLSSENESLGEIKRKIDEWKIQSEDWTIWEELCIDLENRNNECNLEVEKLSSKVTSQYQEIMSLKDQIRGLKKSMDQNLDRSTSSRIKCENSIETCDVDDLLGYITFTDCGLHLKQTWAAIIIKFLDIFLLQTTKWASSSTNIQSAGEKWVWWWKYSMNFLNPAINFLKEYNNKSWTQVFLEKISDFNWKSFVEEYFWSQLWQAWNKKQRIVNIIYKSLPDWTWHNSFFSSLYEIADIMEMIEVWNLDLWTLANNIRWTLNGWSIQRELKTLVRAHLESKK